MSTEEYYMRDSVTSFGEAMDLLWQSPSDIADKEKQTLELFKRYGIKAQLHSNAHFEVLNGCVQTILLYPAIRKIVFHVKGKIHSIQANFDTLYELILGNLAYKKECE